MVNASHLLKIEEQQREDQEKSLKEALGGSRVMKLLKEGELEGSLKLQSGQYNHSFSFLQNIDSLIFKGDLPPNNKELNAKQLKYLTEILNKPNRMDLLFRASEHDFRAAAFHEKCDNKADTVVLVRTEFGKTIGGYTHYPWISPVIY